MLYAVDQFWNVLEVQEEEKKTDIREQFYKLLKKALIKIEERETTFEWEKVKEILFKD